MSKETCHFFKGPQGIAFRSSGDDSAPMAVTVVHLPAPDCKDILDFETEGVLCICYDNTLAVFPADNTFVTADDGIDIVPLRTTDPLYIEARALADHFRSATTPTLVVAEDGSHSWRHFNPNEWQYAKNKGMDMYHRPNDNCILTISSGSVVKYGDSEVSVEAPSATITFYPKPLSSVPQAYEQLLAIFAALPPTANDSDESKLCVACKDAPKNYIMPACNHVVYCQACVQALTRHRGAVFPCPICRMESKPTKIFY